MRLFWRVCGTFAVLIVAVIIAGGAWLAIAPPKLLRVGDGYAAKIVCSNVFLAGRDAAAVLSNDVQAPGNPLLRLIRVSVDEERATVVARILGLFAPGYAVYREGLGCAAVPDGDMERAVAAVPMLDAAKASKSAALWPEGEDAQIDRSGTVPGLITDEVLAGPSMRAIVVVKNGSIIAESYGQGFNAQTPLLGWSMTKTVNAAIIGRLMLSGRMSFDDRNLFPQWRNDQRAAITLSDLLGMESGLAFNEEYGSVTDITRMLYLEPDMTILPVNAPLATAPGSRFSYSSGTSLLLSRIWMDRFPNPEQAMAYPREALFAPLGMSGATLEADEKGTFVACSYLYASARDWVRFGQFLLQDGVWNGERLLPEGFVDAMRTPTKSSGGRYTQVQAWLAGPGGKTSAEAGLPEDTFWLEGHDGQSMAIIPSENLIVLRMGLTPSWLGYQPQPLIKQILQALKN